MNTCPLSKKPIKYSLTALSLCLLASCGVDSSSTAGSTSDPSVKKRDLVSYMYTDATSQPLKGNGIWNYSVATDYYYGTMNPPQSPSLAVDLPANPDANIEYVFATFISLSVGYKSDGSTPALISDQCPSDSSVPKIAYYALPQINPSMYTGALGPCVTGESATAYYAGINKNAPLKVVPVAEYADDSFPAFMSTATSAEITTIATALAQTILKDPSVYGLAIDNEKSINGSNQTPAAPNTTVGQQKEEFFFAELARILAGGKKYLFLFDAPTSAKALYSTYTNIVFMQPLYDLDNSDPAVHTSTAYNPDQLASPYTQSVNNVAAGTLTNIQAPGQSVMFVVPASATSTIWDFEMSYNYPPPNNYVNPILNVPGITANSQGFCSGIPRDNKVTNTVLTAMIDPGYSIDTFLGANNCYLFTNTTPLNDYFLTSLQAITAAKKQTSQQVNYLGAALYAWRISGINDINAAKYYPSIYTAGGGSQKSVNLTGPPDIQSSSWSIFNKWAIADK